MMIDFLSVLLILGGFEALDLILSFGPAKSVQDKQIVNL